MLDDNINKALKKIGKYYATELRMELKKKGHYATKDLDNSIDDEVIGNVLNISANKYLGALDGGSKPYSKSDDAKRIDRFVRWMKSKNLVPRAGRDKKGRFKKNTKSESNYRKAAWIIARSIGLKGIKGSDIIKNAYTRLEGEIEKDLLDAYKLTIQEEIDKIIINIK
jgi:hypothetical protein